MDTCFHMPQEIFAICLLLEPSCHCVFGVVVQINSWLDESWNPCKHGIQNHAS